MACYVVFIKFNLNSKELFAENDNMRPYWPSGINICKSCKEPNRARARRVKSTIVHNLITSHLAFLGQHDKNVITLAVVLITNMTQQQRTKRSKLTPAL